MAKQIATIEVHSKSLSFLQDAKTAIANATSIDEVKQIRDKASAAKVYAKQVGLGREIQNDITHAKILAECKLGDLLREMKEKGERDKGKGGNRKSLLRDAPVKLSELGIERTSAQRCQKMATVPLKQRETYVAQIKATPNGELTSKNVLSLAKHYSNHEKNGHVEAVSDDSCTIVKTLSQLDGTKFACIYADPPWAYGNQGTRAATDKHYETMTVEQIAAMPVAGVASDNAHLHLWTTNGFLFEAKQIIDAWGFEYKSCMIWVKPQIGIGNYWRVSHEFLLFAIRGDLPFRNKAQRSWIEAKRSKHSQKPEAFRVAIEKVSTGPFLELFGRRSVPGWTVHGNKVTRGLLDECVR